jgi:hypothetical protein
MADHIISLSQLREDTLQQILDELNNPPPPALPGTMTKDELLRDWVLKPIKERIRQNRDNSIQDIVQKLLSDATNEQIAAVRIDLGLVQEISHARTRI